MQLDFHYYAAYCAAFLAGYAHEESLAVAYADQFTDVCTADLLRKMNAPAGAATTQSQSELVNHRLDLVGLQEITRIWASFHFLPKDLYAANPGRSKLFLDKYRLICGPNGALLKKTAELARGKGLPAAGLAMHILSDTWAHTYFAGTPSFIINNTDFSFYELTADGGKQPVHFLSSPAAKDEIDACRYVNSMYSPAEKSVMNLGHGRAGHLPDYSFIRYEYMPAWGSYTMLVKDNPADYYRAFCQMLYALKYLRGETEAFETEQYDYETAAPWENTIREILGRRQPDASADWKAFGEALSGRAIPEFDPEAYPSEYRRAGAGADNTPAGQFIQAAQRQKSMVTGEIFRSKNLLAGFVIDGRNINAKQFRDLVKADRQRRKEGGA